MTTYWINVVHVEAIAELDDSRGNFVEEDILLASICDMVNKIKIKRTKK